MLILKRDVVVEAILFKVPTDVKDSLELALDNRDVLRQDGDSVTFANGTKTPYFGGHSKYLQTKKKPFNLVSNI